MPGSEVTSSASSERAAIAARNAVCRRLRVSLGAWAIEGGQPLLERRNRPQGVLPLEIVDVDDGDLGRPRPLARR